MRTPRLGVHCHYILRVQVDTFNDIEQNKRSVSLDELYNKGRLVAGTRFLHLEAIPHLLYRHLFSRVLAIPRLTWTFATKKKNTITHRTPIWHMHDISNEYNPESKCLLGSNWSLFS
jgi:hypothetical protein